MRRLSVGDKKVLIDNEDYESVMRLTWHLIRCKAYVQSTRRIGRKGKRRFNISLHRYILRALPGEIVDHINGNGLDNRKINLRLCTHGQNIQNAHGRNKEKWRYRGVVELRSKAVKNASKWKGRTFFQAMCQGKSLGSFATIEEAARAYDKKALEIWGSRAYQNYPKKT